MTNADSNTVTVEDVDKALPAKLTPEGEALSKMWGVDRGTAELMIEAARLDFDAEPPIPGVTDEDQQRVERYIRAVKKREYELQIATEQFQALKKQIETSIKGLEFMHHHYAGVVVKRLIAAAGGKKKSINFKFGTAGFRASQPKAKILDADKIIAYAKSNGLEGMIVKTKVEVSQSGLTEYVVSTGDVPDGSELVPAGDNFYIK
jgi:phage host-nuclease inhibitor protein Gam